MKLVAEPSVREHIDSHGGAVYVWAKRSGCCRGRTFTLESSTERPDRPFELVHAADGFRVFATPGLIQPDELHLELSRRGKLRALVRCADKALRASRNLREVSSATHLIGQVPSPRFPPAPSTGRR